MRKIALFTLAILLVVMAVVPVMAQEGTAADVLSGNENFSVLLRAVQVADPSVLEALSGSGPLTVFAPTNQAFRNLASTLGFDLEALLGDSELVTQLLLYHVVQGTYFSPQLTELDDTTIPTLLAGTAVGITVNDNGTISINSVADVVSPFDVRTSNGVVHTIDQVVFPSLIMDRLENVGATASVRLAHLSPDARTLDVYVDGAIVASRLGFKDLTDWLTIPAGAHEVAVIPAGLGLTGEGEEGETVSNAVIEPVTLDLESGSYTTIAAVGSRADDSLTAQVIDEGFTAIDQNESRVMVLHAIPGGPAVDLLVGGEALVSNVGFGETATGTLSANTYDLAVVATGETEPLAELNRTTIRSYRFYLVSVVGTADNPEVVVSFTPGIDVITDEMMAASPAEDTEEPAETESTEAEGDDSAAAVTIADIVMNDPNFSTLLRIVEASDASVLEALQGEGPITVFAPTNEAFETLFTAISISLDDAIALGGAPLLTPVLQYHVVPSSNVAADLTDGASLETLLGETIAVTVGDGVVLNGNVNVVTADVAASNGVIHVIDSVLLPQVTIETLAALGINVGGE